VRVGLIDYGAGNQASVRNALEHVGHPPVMVRGPDDLDEMTHLVLPGVGAFHEAMRRLEERGFIDGLRRHASKGKPLLGVCVGMQVLADVGHEFGTCEGLGLIKGTVHKVDVTATTDRLPHIGWNDVTVTGECCLFDGLGEPTFYFAHSYTMALDDEADRAAMCAYGSGVVAAVQKDNVFGVQFHPEKSQHDGLRLLRNFLKE
jgi:glutamine amidotransferase